MIGSGAGIGIITNPHSKLNKRNPERSRLLGYILGQQGQLEVTNNLHDLTRVAREFRERGIEILAINGGDGTICRTLTAFIDEYQQHATPLPRVALLRGGTINMLAANLGVYGSPEQILFGLVEAHSGREEMKIRRLSTLKVEGAYGFLFGNGVAAAFLKEYYKRKSGPFGAFVWGVAVWGSKLFGGGLYDRVVKDLRQTLLPDDRSPIPHRTCAVFCSTVPRMPLRYLLFPQVRDQPGRMQCVSFTFAAKDALWKLPIVMIKMQDVTTPDKLTFTCNSLAIEAEEPIEYTLDGELYVSQGHRLQIDIGPEIDFIIA